ncbi:DUF2846 domain-containing protein [Paraglaciecola aquimarina]|uniref:DUF2846 domain-containing protein n=1 Tax=Paraglaciecola algarum TaxID=3050085 RepID=A0ABS9DEM7_9ALTE|nr:DUF2846 domain-containing protein [Paraglaciecola sp. G1-23]MCF2950497.1 DUF2846 domain-containing protein [Paraglaciecola sp. G1-23]
MKFLFPLLLGLLITGCVSTANGPQFTELNIKDSSLGIAYVYRPNLGYFGQSVYDIDIFIENQKVSSLAKDSYVPIKLTEGKHTITSKTLGAPTVNLELNVTGGDVYYIKTGNKFENKIVVTTHHNNLEVVPESIAKDEISTLKLISNNYNKATF